MTKCDSDFAFSGFVASRMRWLMSFHSRFLASASSRMRLSSSILMPLEIYFCAWLEIRSRESLSEFALKTARAAAAPRMAVVTSPTGPVMATSPSLSAGSILMTEPSAIRNGPMAAAMPPMATIDVLAAGDNPCSHTANSFSSTAAD